MTVHVVGQIRHETEQGQAWELQGIFTKWEDAVAVCVNDKYFIVNIVIDKPLPDGQIHLPTYWPYDERWIFDSISEGLS